MKFIYLFLLFSCAGFTAFGQKQPVTGIVYDSVLNQPVAGATISLLAQKDSSLITFTMTNNAGVFELKNIPAGAYRLLITHVSYHNTNLAFTTDDSSAVVDFGKINMTDLSKVLSEVVVTNEAPPVTLVGDTVQYNAGSFRVAPNSSVEQLLKKMPGIKVDKDGTVTAQGERVNRVLVDGKEFFGTDPKIATRNLPADAVDKVQVYDRQSEQAQLTGFDDGNYEKTINLKLKADKKKGLFGKIMAGGGNKDRYEGRGNVNSFKGARQLSALGLANNTNAEGFSFMDILGFTGALNQRGNNSGNMMVNLSAQEAAAYGMGGNRNGIITAQGGGINYNNIVGTKLDLQSSLFYNRTNPFIESRLLRQTSFNGATNLYNEISNSNNVNNSQRVNLNLLYQLDSFHTLRFIPTLTYQQSSGSNSRTFSTQRQHGAIINDGSVFSQQKNEGYNWRGELLFSKKFNSKGRTFSLSMQHNQNTGEGSGNLQSLVNTYTAGNIKTESLNQFNTTQTNLDGYVLRGVYTEPLWKRSLLEISASNSVTRNTSEKITYDYNPSSSKYDEVNELLTNDFENNYGYTNAGVRLRKQGSKYLYSVGANWQQAQLEGKIIAGNKDSLLSQQFNNILPNAGFRYNFSRFRSLNLNYSTATRQPTAAELQPVPDNSNPLFVRMGNPELKQEYSHSLRGNLNLVSPYKNRNLFLNFNATLTNNKIVSYDSLNLVTGERKSKPVNVDGVFGLNGNVSYGMPLRVIKSYIEISNRFGFNRGKQYFNGYENDLNTVSLRPALRLEINATEKLNLSLGSTFDFNSTTYSLQKELNNRYMVQELNASIDYQLPYNFYLSTEFNYIKYTQRAESFNTHIPLWNASLSKLFLKYNRGEIKLSVHDLLDKNLNISRTTNQNAIEDREINSLRRFFQVAFTYSLSKSGLNKNRDSGGRMIIR